MTGTNDKTNECSTRDFEVRGMKYKLWIQRARTAFLPAYERSYGFHRIPYQRLHGTAAIPDWDAEYDAGTPEDALWRELQEKATVDANSR